MDLIAEYVLPADFQLELTDGLYAIRALVDSLLADQIKQRKLQVGEFCRLLQASLKAVYGGLMAGLRASPCYSC